MAPAVSQLNRSVSANSLPVTPAITPALPDASYIHVASQYIFQQQISGQLIAIGANPTREDTFRLLGVQWISDVRPVRTFFTACCHYHRFRLVHRDAEYQYQDAAAAALLCACKIEDTLKKSKEILCAAHNLKVSPAEHLSPDDSLLEGPSKNVIGLERLALEASGFNFRVRYPAKHLIKLGKATGLEEDVVMLAFEMMTDLYRTFAPIKQTCATMSLACLELATHILNKQKIMLSDERALSLHKVASTTRAEILETLLDLLDLYTHHQKSTIIGPLYNLDLFIDIRIKMNQEMELHNDLPRYTEYHELPRTNGFKMTPKTPITPASPSDLRNNGVANISPANVSPRSSGSGKKGAGARGRDGTIRFMLDAERARKEKDRVAEFFKVEYEEYEIEVEETIRPEREERCSRGNYSRNGHDDRFHKRPRR